jgi:hypothetical protein
MKNIVLAYGLIILAASSCLKKDASTKQVVNPLANSLYLVKSEGGFAPTSIYNAGDVKWDITASSIQVSIATGVSVSSQTPLNTNGIYSYFIDTVAKAIVISNDTFKYELLANSLILDSGLPHDGKRLTFDIVN